MLTYRLIRALLDDDHGISTEAYDALLNWLACHKNGSPELAERITDAAEATDGRWYIPEGADLSLPDPGRMGVK
ncbi:MAG: hypothetical protein CMA05_04440 [Euryarchaeota archaeon]|nr:hypothetical protein [Euryarchaeota archaeon]